MPNRALTRFCLVRHGETDWNAERRLQGQLDIPLNAQGQHQARQLADTVAAAGHRFDALYSSPLSRAYDTAVPLAHAVGLGVTTLPTLMERHFGAMQGARLDDAAQTHPQAWAAYAERSLHHDLYGGESIQAFADRIHAAVNQLARQHCGQRILLVAHGGVLDMIYRLASGQPLQGQRMIVVPNASLNWLSHDGQGWQVDLWADTRHLGETALDEI
ncbi:histidine phosphatase family protein [Vogesella sp. DC21W]|uniref:Histidine phosphatase family protein n=1 Tax=Vogesella aquatica TaxID=2984206 RepID=A0ABT5IYK9_9NEIS|nr:histidine phosphatase family protein [Vogesella aquatica]MDC7717656.1 histidine phosphatase family protein [Vogesella aquatica]